MLSFKLGPLLNRRCESQSHCRFEHAEQEVDAKLKKERAAKEKLRRLTEESSDDDEEDGEANTTRSRRKRTKRGGTPGSSPDAKLKKKGTEARRGEIGGCRIATQRFSIPFLHEIFTCARNGLHN